jgi:DNA-directed RNA polymerase subunit L
MSKNSVTLYNYRPHDEIFRGKIELVCDSEEYNDQFLNAIGRIAVTRIPMYAYAEELIKIERINPESGYHDSVPFNHDMMRLRLKNTPVMNIDPGISFLHERHWKKVDFRSVDREIHEAEKRIEVFIDAKNTSSDEADTESILHVTTNDIKVYVDDVLTKIYSTEYPLLIISLKPKEAFKCSMRAVLGVGIREACWQACSNFCYDQESIPGKTIIKLQSASQFDEFVLIDRSLEYFRMRTKLLKDEIHRMYLLEENPSEHFEIKINDEDHTLGEPINYEIQSHPEIRKSSITKPDSLVRQIIIDVVAFKKNKLLDALMESLDNLISKINTFEKSFQKIERNDKKNKKVVKDDDPEPINKSKNNDNDKNKSKSKSKGKK